VIQITAQFMRTGWKIGRTIWTEDSRGRGSGQSVRAIAYMQTGGQRIRPFIRRPFARLDQLHLFRLGMSVL